MKCYALHLAKATRSAVEVTMYASSVAESDVARSDVAESNTAETNEAGSNVDEV